MTVTVERGARAVGKGTAARPPRRPRSSYALFLLPGALAFLTVIVVPFLMNTGVSFTDWQGVGSPEWTGLANYRELMDDSEFWASFRHSLFMVVAMAAVPTAIGLVLAAALFDYVGRHFGSKVAAVLRACFYLPQVLPIAVAGIVWSWILAPENGSLNEVLKAVGLSSWQQDWLGDPDIALYSVMGVMVWVQLGFPLVIFMAGLQRVDPQLHEAAELDGAGWWRRFWHITLPQIRPEIYVVLTWCTIAALKVFGAVYVLTKGGPGGATNVPSYFSFATFFEKTQVGYGAAISTVLTVIILALSLIGLKLQTRAEDAESLSASPRRPPSGRALRRPVRAIARRRSDLDGGPPARAHSSVGEEPRGRSGNAASVRAGRRSAGGGSRTGSQEGARA